MDELHRVATRVLWNASRTIELKADRPADPTLAGKYLFISTHDGYDAARLDIDKLREEIGKKLGYPYYVAIPNRDFLVAWSKNYAFGDKFAQKVREDFEHQSYPISPLVYRVDHTGIKVAQ
jgi:uncharacterized protein YtpQ (UPF0354 family)